MPNTVSPTLVAHVAMPAHHQLRRRPRPTTTRATMAVQSGSGGTLPESPNMACVTTCPAITPRPRNPLHAKAAPPAMRTERGAAPELAYVVGIRETLIVHLHALLTRVTRSSIPTTWAGGQITLSLDTGT